MTPTQKLTKIKRIYETGRKRPDGSFVTTHAYYNFAGALIDLERKGKPDEVIWKTLHRIGKQLSKIGKVLGE